MGRRHVGHARQGGRFGRTSLALLLLAMLSLGQHWRPTVAHAATFTVDSTLDEPDAVPGDGACKAAPSGKCTLRAAIEEANAITTLDTISLPSETFTLAHGELRITGPTNVVGAGTKATIVQAATDPSGAKHRVLSVWEPAGSRINVSVIGLTVRHGALPPSSFGALDHSGAGVLVGPGAMLRLESVLVSQNVAMSPISSVFVGRGGGIALVGARGLEFIRSTVTGNRAVSGGGAIHCNFFSSGSRPFFRVVDSNVVENMSDSIGGGIDSSRCSGSIERSTIASNQGRQGAGGVNADGTDLVVLNSTIASNTLDEGTSAGFTGRAGGIRVANSGAQLTLNNTTLADNVARVNNTGSDVAHNLSVVGTLPISLTNTVVALRPTSTGSNCAFTSGSVQTISSGGNVEFPGQTCRLTPTTSSPTPDQINVNPRLGLLATNGGPTQTMALQSGSPAIDLIPGANCPTVDQRNLARPRDGNGDGASRCDSGAFEVQSPPVGTFTLAPSASNVAVGQRHAAALTWTVTEGTWHALKSVQVRLREDGRDSGGSDEAHTALQFQWDQDTNTVREVDPQTGQFGPPAALGSETVLESARAALYLKDSRIQGGGLTSPNVTFTMSLAFKPPTKGRTYIVEVAATNDDGASQDFTAAGTIIVER